MEQLCVWGRNGQSSEGEGKLVQVTVSARIPRTSVTHLYGRLPGGQALPSGLESIISL